MTRKEKAEELVSKYYNLESEGDKGGWMTLNDAKQCALITVDEIINDYNTFPNSFKNKHTSYWQEVKNEIEKL
jgi:hypothetical protein